MTSTTNLSLPPGKKIYFASDFHLGLPQDDHDRSREKKICDWLLSIEIEAHAIYLVGDLFDAWMEYTTVVPRGFVRFLGTLAYLRSKGISIEVFTGNHDLWMTDYFEKELDIPVHHDDHYLSVNGQTFYIHHGDGLGPGDSGYKLLRRVLKNPFCQWLYRGLHPNIGIKLAQYFSRKGAKHHMELQSYQGDDKEWLFQFCSNYHKNPENIPVKYFIFGHRHLALEIPIGDQSMYYNCGDWILLDSHVEFDGERCTLVFNK